MKIGNDTSTAFALATDMNGSQDMAALSTTKSNTLQDDIETTVSAASRNLLEDNFFKRDYQQSQYVEAMLSNFDVKNDFRNRMQGMMDMYSLAAAAADPDNYAVKTLAGTKAANSVESIVEQVVAETSAEQLEKEREERETEQQEQLDATGDQKTEIVDSSTAFDEEPASSAGTEEATPAVEKTGDMTTGSAEELSALMEKQSVTEVGEATASLPGANIDIAV
ncbi:hypothetical protein GM415_09880 [Pseudodesulfovibrio cashew]|uniref:Uncharacterized protein n=1 Tax=Pseudodesulfovibrio cashew TaxID=2678688 RepID=A0A6I6JJD1_9BACT|nr:hypothetical protein [Pseudodesulfovibrio cashew]QGY40422.1 hypothetical protein GM415_09880 [Pseudodesulfovibrio cashew]